MKILVWASPPCKAYTTISNLNVRNPKEAYPTIPELRVREIAQDVGDYYIIENVQNCNDLINPIRLNGYAFDRALAMNRLFETNFDVSDKYDVSGTPTRELENGLIERKCHNISKAKKKDLVYLKDAPTNLKIQELREFIPPYYVSYLLNNISEDITHVLDLCCGAGGVAHGIKKHNSDIKVVGIDKRNKRDKYPCEFIHGDVRNSEVIDNAVSKLMQK